MIKNGIGIDSVRKGWESRCLHGGVTACMDCKFIRMGVHCREPCDESWLDGVQHLDERFIGSTEEGDASEEIFNADARGPAQT